MLRFEDIVFGPVHSRRLGASLGVNLLPPGGKLCNFDCIYCECGWNKDGLGGGRMPGAADVRTAMQRKFPELVREGVKVDSITFSGNGEPTLNPDFAKIVDTTVEMRDRYLPDAAITVLSNATMLHRPGVLAALKKVDNNILKLDTVDEDYIRLVDRPAGHYDVARLVERLKAFEGKVIIQTMFMKGSFEGKDVDNTSARFVEPWLKAVKEIGPSQVMIYTIDRETPDHDLRKATHEELDRIAARVRQEGLAVSVSY